MVLIACAAGHVDADGEAVPKDWCLRLAGEAQRVLGGAPLAEGDLSFALPQPQRASR